MRARFASGSESRGDAFVLVVFNSTFLEQFGPMDVAEDVQELVKGRLLLVGW